MRRGSARGRTRVIYARLSESTPKRSRLPCRPLESTHPEDMQWPQDMQAVFQKFFTVYDDTEQDNSIAIGQAGPK